MTTSITTTAPFPVTISGLVVTMTPSTSDSGTYSATVTISDGANTAVTSTFSITLVNLPPAFATPPVTQSISVGNTVPYPLPAAVDPEGATVIITLSSPALFISLSGTNIIMTPSLSLITDIGTFLVTLTLSDGFNIVTVTFNVVVANLPPAFSSAPIA